MTSFCNRLELKRKKELIHIYLTPEIILANIATRIFCNKSIHQFIRLFQTTITTILISIYSFYFILH